MAETFGIANKAKNALKIKWSVGPDGPDVRRPDRRHAQRDHRQGDLAGRGCRGHVPLAVRAARPDGGERLLGVFKDGKYEGWGGAQVPTTMQRQIAETLGVKVEDVTYHVIPAGGAFGRHLFHDQDVQVAQIAQRIGKPIKLQWMREEGIKNGRSRPVSIHKVKATVTGGDVTSYEHRMACPEMDLRHGLGDVATGYVTEYNNEGACQYFFTHTQKMFYKTGPDGHHAEAAPAGQAHRRMAGCVLRPGPRPRRDHRWTSWPGRSARTSSTTGSRRWTASATRPCSRRPPRTAQWGKKLPAGVAQGIGMHDEYKSIVAYVMTVDTRGKEPQDDRRATSPSTTASASTPRARSPACSARPTTASPSCTGPVCTSTTGPPGSRTSTTTSGLVCSTRRRR